MTFLKKTIIVLSILSFLSLHFPKRCLSWQQLIYAKSKISEDITKHTPEFFAPLEQKIPLETKTPIKTVEKKKKNTWLWVGLGVLAAGVLAGAGGGGDGTPPPTTGDITVQWND